MRHNARNNSQSGNRFFNHLAAEKKKAVLALCLIALMTFMWIKMFTRTSPKAAEAGLMTGLMDLETQSEPEIKIPFIELPKVEGRNDLIARDFFASNGCRNLLTARDGNQSVLKK